MKRYHATEPDHFELVDSQTYVYDPAIFPLYHGYAPGSANTAVYKAGGTTVWVRIKKYAWLLLPAIVLAIFVLHSFFKSDGSSFVKIPQQSPRAVSHAAVASKPAVPVVPATLAKVAYDLKGMPVEVRYVFDLCNRARPRLAAVVQGIGEDRGVIEWQSDHGDVLDRMTFDQVRDLGVAIAVHRYGVKLTWGTQAVVVTPWPLPDTTGSLGDRNSSRQGDASTQASVAGRDVPAAPGVASGNWHDSVMRADYVPPELEKRPDYSPHTRS